jgi:hypothetical protein
MYMVISKPKRKSQALGVSHFMSCSPWSVDRVTLLSRLAGQSRWPAGINYRKPAPGARPEKHDLHLQIFMTDGLAHAG